MSNKSKHDLTTWLGLELGMYFFLLPVMAVLFGLFHLFDYLLLVNNICLGSCMEPKVIVEVEECKSGAEKAKEIISILAE